MSIGLVLGLIAALCWGSTDVSAAYSGRRLGSIRVAAIVQLTSLLAVVVMCAVRSSGLPAKPEDSLASVLNGIVAAGAYLAFFTALRIGPVSVVSPVVAAYGGLTVVLAVVIRGETLTPLQATGAAIATCSVQGTWAGAGTWARLHRSASATSRASGPRAARFTARPGLRVPGAALSCVRRRHGCC